MTSTLFDEFSQSLKAMERRERRRRLVALVGGQAKIARRLGVHRSTVCHVVAGWDGGTQAAQVDGVIRQSLRKIARQLEELWAA
jgi:DNA-binding transcriptional regulator YdaS (Cro superfamily)